MADLSVMEDEVNTYAEPKSLVGIRKKALRLVPNDEFEVFQLSNNHSWPIKIDVGLLDEVREGLIEFLRSNFNLFSISPRDV